MRRYSHLRNLAVCIVSSVFAFVQPNVILAQSQTAVSRALTTKVSVTGISTTFDPSATTNLAVYFGHSTGSSNASLIELCDATGPNIVILGFVRQFATSLDILPTVDFTSTCSYDALTVGATGLACPMLAEQIEHCQALGKKVFISIGGSKSNTTFNDPASAKLAAHNLWEIFGSGTGNNKPFGKITVDGFDIGMDIRSVQGIDGLVYESIILTNVADHETGPTDYYSTFASTLKDLFTTTSREYYISASPLCANTSVVFSGNFYQYVDFVWARFYNAQECAVGSAGFNASFKTWSNYLTMTSSTSTFPKLYLGGLSFDNNQSGYVPPDSFASFVKQARELAPDRFGGVMLWDGTYGLETEQAGQTFIDVTEKALLSGASSAKMSSQRGLMLGLLLGVALWNELLCPAGALSSVMAFGSGMM